MTDEEVLNEFECEGQISFFDNHEPEQTMIAVSRIFARAAKEMSVAEWKTAIYALTQVRWTERNPGVVVLDKKELARIVGVNSDANHRSVDLNRKIGELPKHSFIQFSDKDRGVYDNGVFISRITMLNESVRVVFQPEYLPLFQELNKDGNYITMWASDLFQMRSERSILFYEDMRYRSDTRNPGNYNIYSTREIKELLSIPKDGKGSYTDSNGKLNRYMFERKVLGPIVEDLVKCRMINLHVNPDGSYWEKVKKNGHVVGYRFEWDVSTHPRIASAKEVAEFAQDPMTIKVAKDILAGKKNPSKKSNSFNNFEQNIYDFDELEKRLLAAEIANIDIDEE